jgi:hypothetical protein
MAKKYVRTPEFTAWEQANAKLHGNLQEAGEALSKRIEARKQLDMLFKSGRIDHAEHERLQTIMTESMVAYNKLIELRAPLVEEEERAAAVLKDKNYEHCFHWVDA